MLRSHVTADNLLQCYSENGQTKVEDMWMCSGSLKYEHIKYTNQPEYPSSPHSPHTSTSKASLEIISLSNSSMLEGKKEGRKQMFYLTMHSTHFFNVILYGVRHTVKDHSDNERGNPLSPHGLLFPISSKGSFICIIPHRIAHTMGFVTPVVEH